MNIGTVLESKRAERGISYAELARRTHINEDMVSRFCSGSSMPKGYQLIRLCKELELDIEDFEEAVPDPELSGCAPHQ